MENKLSTGTDDALGLGVRKYTCYQGVMELHIPPLHALINFFLAMACSDVITAYFLSISPFRQSYYFITPRGLDLTHSRDHLSR